MCTLASRCFCVGSAEERQDSDFQAWVDRELRQGAKHTMTCVRGMLNTDLLCGTQTQRCDVVCGCGLFSEGMHANKRTALVKVNCISECGRLILHLLVPPSSWVWEKNRHPALNIWYFNPGGLAIKKTMSLLSNNMEMSIDLSSCCLVYVCVFVWMLVHVCARERAHVCEWVQKPEDNIICHIRGTIYSPFGTGSLSGLTPPRRQAGWLLSCQQSSSPTEPSLQPTNRLFLLDDFHIRTKG